MPDRAPLPKPCPNPAPARWRNTRAEGYPPTGGTRRGTVARSARFGETLPDVQAELREAVDEVAATFDALPSSLQDRIGEPMTYGLNSEVSAAEAADDSERALAAIRAWRGHWLASFEEATR